MKIALDPAMYHAKMSVADELRTAADLGYEYLELSPRPDWFLWHRYPKGRQRDDRRGQQGRQGDRGRHLLAGPGLRLVRARRAGTPGSGAQLEAAAAAARQALEQAEQAGVPLTVYQNRRYDADCRTVRAVIGSGELGHVTRFESRIEQYAPAAGIPDSGGGILLDLGAHLADQALLLFGPVMSVYAELDDVGGRPGRFFVTLRHAGGVISHLVGTCSCTACQAPGFACSAAPAATMSALSTDRPMR